MADLFTLAQAQSSSIKQVREITLGGNHHSWKVQISGSDGKEYQTRIKSLDGDASLDDIKGELLMIWGKQDNLNLISELSKNDVKISLLQLKQRVGPPILNFKKRK